MSKHLYAHFQDLEQKSRNRKRGCCMGINSYKFSQLFQWLQLICTKQMYEFIFYSFFFSAIIKFLIEKMSLKNNFENRFSKPKTGFRFSNRKPDFRFSINIPNSSLAACGVVCNTCCHSVLFHHGFEF